MSDSKTPRPYDLEERTFQFAKNSRVFAKEIPKTVTNLDDIKQFIRASGSIGANYIEANECIGKRDFVMKIKTCRREEGVYWLRLLETNCPFEPECQSLLNEAVEL